MYQSRVSVHAASLPMKPQMVFSVPMSFWFILHSQIIETTAAR